MRKVTWLVVASVLIACVLVMSMWMRRPHSTEMRRLRVGYIPIADCTQLYVAIEKGYFAKRGIQVELVSLAGGAKILEALGAKSLDIGFSNLISLILAHAQGLPFVAITGGPAQDEQHKEHAIIVRKDSAIKAVRDLAGKRIALNTKKNIDELMVSLLLEKHGVRVSDVTFLEVPFPRMLGVLAGGDVDAVAEIEPFVTLGAKDAANHILTYNYLEIQPFTEISTYVVRESWLKDERETAASFSAALREAATYANLHPDEVRQILTTYTKLDSSQVRDMTLPLFTENLSPDRLDAMIGRVRDIGWIDKKFPASTLIRSL